MLPLRVKDWDRALVESTVEHLLMRNLISQPAALNTQLDLHQPNSKHTPCCKASLATTNVGRGRGSGAIAVKKILLKPLHWVKVSRAAQGSLWADSQKQGSDSRVPEIDISEFETLIKFCPTKEEMEVLKNYTGNKDMLGKCEQFFYGADEGSTSRIQVKGVCF
ncbi:hypothetical protein KIW84_045120 [Lathyrus oleraceus]|uniref:FH2 domain-containing protein n=1 Tax=Pisum sativum TaxID=3888 RepID=A0A9D4XJI2_PEA|nr:hypothetical protein KIW84_045120 [Pisum sativum]